MTAASHKVINNLLETVLKIADKSGVSVGCIRKVTELSESPGRISEFQRNEDIDDILKHASPPVIGGTPFLCARAQLHGKVDVIFVDEAGQMSLANVLAASQCARGVVLLGDPQQLDVRPETHAKRLHTLLHVFDVALHACKIEHRGGGLNAV